MIDVFTLTNIITKIIAGKLSKICISEVCIKPVALRINRYTRNSSLSGVCSPVATGGLPLQKCSKPLQIKVWITINRLNFYQISECQSPY